MPYPTLYMMMQNKRIGCWEIAKCIKTTSNIAEKKIMGKLGFTKWEMVKIKQALGTDKSITELFKQEGQ